MTFTFWTTAASYFYEVRTSLSPCDRGKGEAQISEVTVSKTSIYQVTESGSEPRSVWLQELRSHRRPSTSMKRTQKWWKRSLKHQEDDGRCLMGRLNFGHRPQEVPYWRCGFENHAYKHGERTASRDNVQTENRRKLPKTMSKEGGNWGNLNAEREKNVSELGGIKQKEVSFGWSLVMTLRTNVQ